MRGFFIPYFSEMMHFIALKGWLVYNNHTEKRQNISDNLEMRSVAREQWRSKLGFVLAAAGSAVGLGNIWKFPYVTGHNGGAAFVVIYLVAVLLVGFSVMLAELAIGRATQKNVVGAYRTLQGPRWAGLGFVGLFCGMLILSYYSVIGGWTLKYLWASLTASKEFASEGAAAAYFGHFTTQGWQVFGFQILFLLLTAYVVLRGVSGGLERWCKALMPALLVMLVVLVVRSLSLPGSGKGVEFYLKPDFSKVTGATFLAAVSQAFFSLSIGLGTMLTYGSYLRKDVDLGKSALQICALDTLVALLAGLVIFPAAFAFGVDAGAGPGLSFVTLPALFSRVPFGALWAFVFFALLFVAALTSSISMLEIPVAYLLDKGMKRKNATWLMTVIILLMGVPSALGDSLGWKIFGLDMISAGSFLSDSLLMPFGGFMCCLVAGWLQYQRTRSELEMGTSPWLVRLWSFGVKFVAPLAILAVFIAGLRG